MNILAFKLYPFPTASYSIKKKPARLQGALVPIIPASSSLRRTQNIERAQKWAERIATHSRFDTIILILIGISSISLALDNPFNDPEGFLAISIGYVDIFLTFCFTVEMAVKVLSIGFIYHDDSYLRDGWNFLDFCIVILSIASLFLNDPNLASIRSLRALRALRPLRLISRAPGMKKVVNALLSSIPSILNVLLVCSLFFLIFGILGTYQLKGKLFYCEMDHLSSEVRASLEQTYGFTTRSFKKLFSKEACIEVGRQWKNSPSNFDNVMKSMMLLFEMSTTEGWVDMMFRGIDATEIGFHPVENAHREISVFFICKSI